MDEDIADLSAWAGKTPEKSKILEPSNNQPQSQPSDSDSPSDVESRKSNSDSSGSIVDINYDVQPDTIVVNSSPARPTWKGRGSSLTNGGSDVDMEDVQLPRRNKSKVFIEIRKLSDEEKVGYEFLPGHFTVRRIVSQLRGNRYFIKLESGEHDVVSERLLRRLENGKDLLEEFSEQSSGRMSTRTPNTRRNRGTVDYRIVEPSDSDTGVRQFGRRKKQSASDSDDDQLFGLGHEEEESDDRDELQLSDQSEPSGRRSSRLTAKKKQNYFQKELVVLEDSDEELLRRKSQRKRGAARPSLRPSRWSGHDSSLERLDSVGARRSERTRTIPRRSMREMQENEIEVHSEEETGPKIVGTKEYFSIVPKHDPFRRRHRQNCDVCNYPGDNSQKGLLVYCQGCTTSYHKFCLGSRGTRDHLVTKVGEALFILQCRRCLGKALEKDHTAPHHGTCSVCQGEGALSKPLRSRLTTRQEQRQREENGGKDPITIVDPNLVNNISNVMFRCSQCQRAWHMHHLPERKIAISRPEDEDEEISEQKLAQRRFEQYHRSWTCKDCIENQSLIDTIIAWRPTDAESYIPGVTVEMMQESQKEYLIKWKSQSYFHTSWMPGSWVWGIAAGSMRMAFMKKPENLLPKFTTKDAIPEDFFRIDIVFDVRYTSVVRNSTKEIDLARIKEVDMTYVKYKGLGYEDAIWEKPPSYTDTDRWNDFKAAYEDYVMKFHVSIPLQSTLRRHLLATRNLDFATVLAKKNQPTNMTGGELMGYQLEGLNWLYFQWFQQQNAVLADEMGLGKTIQIISFFATLVQDHKCWPFLVVVPNSTCPNWRREIKKWVPTLRVVPYYGSSAARKLTHDLQLFSKNKQEEKEQEEHHHHHTPKRSCSGVKDINAHIVITSYESISEDKTRQSLLRVPWQGLIVDEGQRLKNDKNLVYESLSQFRFPFKVLLTGTPLQNNPRELFNLLQFIDKSNNAAEMEQRYARLTQDNLPELHELLRKYFLRRTKAQVLTSLPPMAQIIIPISLSPLQKKVYKSILAKNPALMKSIFSREGPVGSKERLSLNNILMQLRKTLCHPYVYSRGIEDRSYEPLMAHQNLVEASSKLQLLSLMLPKLQERGHRVLLFSQFLDNLDVLEDFLDGMGMQHRRLDGTINALEKQKRIDDFNAPGSPYFAFLLSTRAGGVGINLATADTVIILDPDFNPHQDIQALSRAHRIGQKQKVLVFQLMTRGSVEEKIMQIGKRKMALDHVLIERMDESDEAGIDLESILRFGAEALFADENKEGDADGNTASANDIIYDSASVDRLLDRSQIEDTKISEGQSAESQFSFARVWMNDKAALEDGNLAEDAESTETPALNHGIWDKILEEREKAYEEEAKRKAETLGRGKRKRTNVDYKMEDLDENMVSPGGGPRKIKKTADGDFTERDLTNGEEDDEASDEDNYRCGRSMDLDGARSDPRNRSDQQSRRSEVHFSNFDPQSNPRYANQQQQQQQPPTIRAQPFKRVRVPGGDPPFFDNTVQTPAQLAQYIPPTGLPALHDCMACHEIHPMGWCRFKIAGVEHCGLCGIAHFGHSGTCPHLHSEAQVATLLQTLEESIEDRDLVEQAVRYLRTIRGDLVQRRRKEEEKLKAERERRGEDKNDGGRERESERDQGLHIERGSWRELEARRQRDSIAGYVPPFMNGFGPYGSTSSSRS